MKKYRFFSVALLCALAFCSCAVTSNVTSYGVFINTIKEVSQDLQEEGFSLVSTENDRRNVTTHAPEYYNHFEHGFSGNNSIDYIYTNTYHFENEEGEKMTYSVSYQTGGNPSTLTAYVREVYTGGCQTSNAKDYERLCGDSSPIHKLDSLPKNSTIRR